MAAYLLGELSDDAQLELERDYFVRDETYQQMLAVEDELAYDYVEGRLSPERRRRFETTIGATERGRKNLEFARSLLSTLVALRTRERRSLAPWAAAIAAAVVIALIAAWAALRVARLDTELASARNETKALEARLRTAPAMRPALEVSFLLTPGATRSGEGPARLEVLHQADTARFELVLPPETAAGDYAISLRWSRGAEIWSRSEAVTGRTVAIAVPAGALTGGSYEIGIRRLTAGEQLPDLATYSFRLIRR
jgi:hypothetical protein